MRWDIDAMNETKRSFIGWLKKTGKSLGAENIGFFLAVLTICLIFGKRMTTVNDFARWDLKKMYSSCKKTQEVTYEDRIEVENVDALGTLAADTQDLYDRGLQEPVKHFLKDEDYSIYTMKRGTYCAFIKSDQKIRSSILANRNGDHIIVVTEGVNGQDPHWFFRTIGESLNLCYMPGIRLSDQPEFQAPEVYGEAAWLAETLYGNYRFRTRNEGESMESNEAANAFPCAYAVYTMQPDLLKKYCPNLYNYMENLMKEIAEE